MKKEKNVKRDIWNASKPCGCSTMIFFTVCFQDDKACTELVLRIIMGKDDLHVLKVTTQKTVSNLQGHSVRLDAYAVDGSGVCYDIEVQRDSREAIPQRARYNGSLIDAQALAPGAPYSSLPECYVIFITENDVLKKNRPICHIDRVIRETGDAFGDGSHIIYVNTAVTDDSPLGKLMQDFTCTEPAVMHYPTLADRTKYFKQEKKGVNHMCDFWEELINEGRKEAEEEANAKVEQANAQAEQANAQAEQAIARAEQAKAEAEQAKAEAERAYAQVESVKQNARSYPIKTALRMIKDGLASEKIAVYTGLPIEEVNELISLTSA